MMDLEAFYKRVFKKNFETLFVSDCKVIATNAKFSLIPNKVVAYRNHKNAFRGWDVLIKTVCGTHLFHINKNGLFVCGQRHKSTQDDRLCIKHFIGVDSGGMKVFEKDEYKEYRKQYIAECVAEAI